MILNADSIVEKFIILNYIQNKLLVKENMATSFPISFFFFFFL